LVRKVFPFISVAYSLVIAVLSLIKTTPSEDLPVYSDKIFHAIAYCLFALIWFLSLHYSFKKEKKQSINIAVVGAIVFGIVIEILQHTLTQNRQGDYKDVIANTIGACLAVLIINIITKRNVKN